MPPIPVSVRWGPFLRRCFLQRAGWGWRSYPIATSRHPSASMGGPRGRRPQIWHLHVHILSPHSPPKQQRASTNSKRPHREESWEKVLLPNGWIAYIDGLLGWTISSYDGLLGWTTSCGLSPLTTNVLQVKKLIAMLIMLSVACRKTVGEIKTRSWLNLTSWANKNKPSPSS